MSENVITDPKEIENLYQSFRTKKVEVTLRYELKEYNAQIYRVSHVSITLFYKGDIPETIDYIEMSTTMAGAVFFATCRVVNISSGEITLSYPEQLEKRIKRKYKRVNTKGDVYLKFHVISSFDEKLDFTDHQQHLPPQFMAVAKELEQPVPDIKRIFSLLAQELKKKASLFDIKLYRPNESYPKRVEILKEFKKIIFIENVRDSKAYLKNHQNIKAVSFLPYIHQLKADGKGDQDIRDELITIMKEDIKTTAISYICSPIMLFGQVIGHVFLGVTGGSYSIFRDHDLYFVQSSCEIISEALAKSRLNKLDTGDNFDVIALDLSAGGLSMQFADQFILKHLSADTKLRMVLKVIDKEIKVVGKIIRIDREGDEAEVAIKFTEIRWNDQENVDKYVNRKLEMDKMQQPGSTLNDN